MKIRLGYVANPITFDKILTYKKTITYTNYIKLEKNKQKKRNELIASNLEALKKVLEYNVENEIYFHRITHDIVPLATKKDMEDDYFFLYKDKFLEIGKIIKENKMRIDFHPDEFCVLNSQKEEVVEQSIRTLKFHHALFIALGIKSKMILHIGSGKDSKEEGLRRFKENFLKLPLSIRKEIIIENDDRIYNVIDTLNLCEELKVPMVLDYHHYLCNKGKEKIEDYLKRIIDTWENTGLNPKIHFSSPKSNKEKISHSTYINFKDFLKFIDKLKKIESDTDFDIMLECKAKDEALFRLSRQLNFFTNLIKINSSTFILK